MLWRYMIKTMCMFCAACVQQGRPWREELALLSALKHIFPNLLKQSKPPKIPSTRTSQVIYIKYTLYTNMYIYTSSSSSSMFSGEMMKNELYLDRPPANGRCLRNPAIPNWKHMASWCKNRLKTNVLPDFILILFVLLARILITYS